jgi:hypothetical protein
VCVLGAAERESEPPFVAAADISGAQHLLFHSSRSIIVYGGGGLVHAGASQAERSTLFCSDMVVVRIPRGWMCLCMYLRIDSVG